MSSGVLIQLEVFVSTFSSVCKSRYCFSVNISIPISFAISIALFSVYVSFSLLMLLDRNKHFFDVSDFLLNNRKIYIGLLVHHILPRQARLLFFPSHLMITAFLVSLLISVQFFPNQALHDDAYFFRNVLSRPKVKLLVVRSSILSWIPFSSLLLISSH